MTPERWERIQELFEAACERPAEERAAFLAGTCSDESLRREVESLLSHHARAASFLTSPTGSTTASRVSPGLPHEDLLAGRFRIVRLIGRGGMGEVYEAEDLDLKARVALKTLRSEIARDERALARFKQEIYLARKITHPNVCRTFDVAYHHAPGGEAIVFLTMELLQGETIAEKCLEALGCL